MNRAEIMRIFRQLAQSQGYYGRLLESLEADEDLKENVLTHLEDQNFGDTASLIMFVEGA